MSAVDKLIEVLEAEVGYLEKASNYDLYSKTGNAGYNNYTKYGYEMHKLYPATMDFPAPWCDSFCDWSAVKAFGVETAEKLLHGFDDYTVNSAQKYKDHGEWYTSPERGDQIFFKDSTGICHTGWVVGVDSSRVYTIEGNTSAGSTVVPNGGGVYKKNYVLSNSRIAGYGRPDYSIVEEELTMGQYEELKALIDEANNKNVKQDDIINTMGQEIVQNKSEIDAINNPMIYNYVDDNMPEWAREAVNWEIGVGILQGTDNGLDLTYNDLRQIQREYRLVNYMKQLLNLSK